MTLSLIIFYQWKKNFRKKSSSQMFYEVLNTPLNLPWSVFIHRSSTGGALQKKLFLKISQYSQENTCIEEHFRTTASSFSSTFSFSCYFKSFISFMTKISIIYKPVQWFAEQNLNDRDLRPERVKWKP